MFKDRFLKKKILNLRKRRKRGRGEEKRRKKQDTTDSLGLFVGVSLGPGVRQRVWLRSNERHMGQIARGKDPKSELSRSQGKEM